MDADHESLRISLGAQQDPPGTEDPSEAVPLPDTLPILPLSSLVVFPFTTVTFTITDRAAQAVVDQASVTDRMVGLFTLRASDQPLSTQSLYTIGTLGVIQRLVKGPDSYHLSIKGRERIAMSELVDTAQPRARVKRHPESPYESTVELRALLNSLLETFRGYVALSIQVPVEQIPAVAQVEQPLGLVYTICSSLPIDWKISQEVLEFDQLSEKISRLSAVLRHETEVLKLGRKIESEARSEIDRSQREYILREQLKAIQAELGEGESAGQRALHFEQRIAAAGMPKEAEEQARRELSRLASLPAGSPEYPMIQGYLEWLTELPWSKSTSDTLEIEHARRVLDEDHYDLARIKERILEYLSVRKLRSERGKAFHPSEIPSLRPIREGAILCFAGPPGVGKTSLGASIARALGRTFHRISLGGVRDEAEIRGHRRTYVGAMPGRFIQAIRRAGSKNPVIVLDEVDKIGADWRGDPSSALLEVLDPEQNSNFVDHYLDLAFDLSQVLFIATANVLHKIPAPLRDRMEVLELSGYTDEEKLHIAIRYLIPRQRTDNGLLPTELFLREDALLAIIREYTREAGVRELERQIGTICRKSAAQIAGGETPKAELTPVDVRSALGARKFFYDTRERTAVAGVATGLAYTEAGGDVLFVEATRMPGNKSFTLTGQLGEVMKESAQAALSIVRGRTELLGIEQSFFDRSDLHVHVPTGAVPKDGPSAGVTIVAALASLLTGRPVRGELGMTGEVTLRGKILPVGGIKEKLLAAHRAGLRSVILPRHNEKDLEEIPAHVRAELTITLVDSVEELLSAALSAQPTAIEQAAVSALHH